MSPAHLAPNCTWAARAGDTATGKYERAKLREALADVPVKCEPATLPGAVAQLVLELDRIGFGTNHPLSGAMCVDVVNENLTTLREFIA